MGDDLKNREPAKRLRELAAGVRSSGNAVPMTAAELTYLAEKFDQLSSSQPPSDCTCLYQQGKREETMAACPIHDAKFAASKLSRGTG